MVNKHCCYGTCRSDSRHKDRAHMQGVDFIRFPRPKVDHLKCKKWLKACGRPSTGDGAFTVEMVNRFTFICTKHFVGGKGPTQEYPDPIPALTSNVELKSFERKKRRKAPMNREDSSEFAMMKRRKRSSIPSSLTEQSTQENYDIGVQDCVTPTKTGVCHSTILNTPKLLRLALTKEPEQKKLTLKAAATQTDLTGMQLHVVFNELSDQDLSQSTAALKRKLFTATILKDDQHCKFYLGLPLTGFFMILNFIHNTAEKMTYWRGECTRCDGAVPQRKQQEKQRILSVENELILTLLRLRRGMDVNLLADLMGISRTSVSRIITSWIHLLSRELSFLVTWPTRNQIKSRMPRAFHFFPNTRVIIDCTEFQLQLFQLKEKLTPRTNIGIQGNVYLASLLEVRFLLCQIFGLVPYQIEGLWKDLVS